MNINIKWGILAGFAAIALATSTGCDTKGGSSADTGGSTNKPAIVQISFGKPTCSSTGEGSVNGPVFNGAAGYLYVAPTCANPDDKTYVWLKVVSDVNPVSIKDFIWKIKNWDAASPHGILDHYDELIESNGVFKVRTSLNQIRYISASATDLSNLASLFTEKIDVTVETADGQMASGYISLNLHSGKAFGDAVVFGTLTSLDSFSQARPNRFADYYSIRGAGLTNVIGMEGDFDTYLVLYDANLNGIVTNDDVNYPLETNSLITWFLAPDATYYVEATSFDSPTVGNYSLSVTNSAGNGILTNVPNPFDSGGSCDNIAGDYSVTEIIAINLTFGGQVYAVTNVVDADVTIYQDENSCDFAYQVVDPSGLIPPVTRRGRINFTSLELYNETYIPQSPEIFIDASSLTGSGRNFATGLNIDSAGSVEGKFLGLPFRVDYSSTATFLR